MAEVDWSEQASGLLRRELARRKVDYRELATLLTGMGLPHTEHEVTAEIEGGAFSAAFFVQCLEAVGAPVVRLDY